MPRRLTSKVLSQALTSAPRTGPKYGFVAALLTRMSILANFAMTCSTRRCRSSGLPAWAGIATARSGNRALMRSASASRSACFRLESTTCAPCSARAVAMALPMPRLAPVTRATRPLRSKREGSGTADRIGRHGHDLGEGGRRHPRAHLPARDQTDCARPGRRDAEAPQAAGLCRDVEQGLLLAHAHPEVRARLRDGAGEPFHALRLLPHAHGLEGDRPRGHEQPARPL